MLLLNDVLAVLKNNLNNQKTKKVILLIDEPEKFLHPTLISILGKILCQLYYEHNISLILTTHSPILLKSIVENSRYLKQKSSKSSKKEENITNNSTNIKEKDSTNKEYPNIILFKKDITDTEEPYRQSNIDLFKKDNEKFELLQPALSHIINSLFAEKIILVEGIRDEAFVNILIDLINKKYEKYQYVLIMPVGGCDHAIKIGKILKENYQINFFMILDLDDKNEKNNEVKLKEDGFNEQKYFLFKSDFEN
ncbi:AAA family ATPase [bacterium]|nr:AAA family ATPase [bacterium]